VSAISDDWCDSCCDTCPADEQVSRSSDKNRRNLRLRASGVALHELLLLLETLDASATSEACPHRGPLPGAARPSRSVPARESIRARCASTIKATISSVHALSEPDPAHMSATKRARTTSG